MPYFKSLNAAASVMDVFQLSPELTNPLLDYHEILLRGPSPLSIGERELIATFVSGINDCAFCHAAHAATAEAYGMKGAGQLNDSPYPEVDEKMQPILHYVRKLTQAPASVTAEDSQAVYDAGWSEQALHHAIHVCALFNFMNRLVEGHGIAGLNPKLAGQLGRRLHDHGYTQFKEDLGSQ